LETGEFEVYGWAEKNAAFTKNWENGGKGGRPSKTANKNPNTVSGNPNPVSGNPNPVSGNPNPVSGNPKDVWVNPKGSENAIWENPNPVLENRRKEGIEGIEGIEGRKEGTVPVGPATSFISWNPASGWTGFTPELRQTLKNASYTAAWANGAKGLTKKPNRQPIGHPWVTHGYTQPINSGTYRTPEGRKE
jgi:hypothetical protein